MGKASVVGVIVVALVAAGCVSARGPMTELNAQTGTPKRPELAPVAQVGKVGRWVNMTFSPDGTQMVAGTDQGLYVWDVATGAVIVGFDGRQSQSGWVRPVYSLDGSFLAICESSELITVLETEEYSVVARLRPPDDITDAAGFAFGEAKGGRPVLAITYDARVAIWDSKDWTVDLAPERLVNRLDLPICYVPSARRFLIISAKEHLIYSVSTDGSRVEMIEWPTGGEDGEPLALEVGRGPAELFLGRDAENVASLWELGDGRLEMAGGPLDDLRGSVITLIGTGERVLAWQNGMSAILYGQPRGRGMQIRDARTGETIREFGGEIEPYEVIVSPDSRRVATRARGEAVLWNAETGERLGELDLADHPPFEAPVAVSPDGRMIAALMPDGRGALWDLTDVRMLRALDGAVGSRLQFSRDGQRLIAYGMESAVVWDVSSGRKLGTIRPGAWGLERPSSFHLSPDGKLVAAALRNKDKRWSAVRLYDASSGKPVGTPVDQRHAMRIGTVAWSPDGSRLLISGHDAMQGGPPRLILVEVDGGEIVWENSDGLEAAYEFAVMSDGLHAIVRDGRRIAAIDMRTGEVASEHEVQLRPDYMRVAADGGMAIFTDGPHHETETHLVEPLTWRTISESPLPVRLGTAPGPNGAWIAHSHRAGISLRDARTSAIKLTLWGVTERQGERKATWEDEWVAFTPEGYWTGSKGAGKYLRWRDEAGTLFTADEVAWLEDAAKVREAMAE